MDYSEIERALKSNGAVADAANSAEARRLMGKLDTAAVERAAKRGDSAALKRILGQVLSTPEGRALAEKVQGAVRRNG
ncbi:MAG: hypothetical protein IJ617_04500 [Oscillospiraceae bacterium]|nr:hypothetical protein [Oscillospiraceae bacterium]